MTKLCSSAEITCEDLKIAYNQAQENLYDDVPRLGGRIVFDTERYGNQVSGKGTLTGCAECGLCGKKVSITLNLNPIEGAYDLDTRQPVKLYSSIYGKESIKLSGHPCGNLERS